MEELYKTTEIRTLEELASEESLVLFDTSATDVLGKNRRNLEFHTEQELTQFTRDGIQFLIELRKYIKESNFFITNPVFEELEYKEHYPYKKIIRKEGQCKNRELLELRREIRRFIREQGRTLTAFYDNQRVLPPFRTCEENKPANFFLDEKKKKLYEELHRRYLELRRKYELSDANYDFLITGITLAKTSTPVIFLSNDYNIFYARNAIVRDNLTSKQSARFFTRIGLFEFRGLEIPKNNEQN